MFDTSCTPRQCSGGTWQKRASLCLVAAARGLPEKKNKEMMGLRLGLQIEPKPSSLKLWCALRDIKDTHTQ